MIPHHTSYMVQPKPRALLCRVVLQRSVAVGRAHGAPPCHFKLIQALEPAGCHGSNVQWVTSKGTAKTKPPNNFISVTHALAIGKECAGRVAGRVRMGTHS